MNETMHGKLWEKYGYKIADNIFSAMELDRNHPMPNLDRGSGKTTWIVINSVADFMSGRINNMVATRDFMGRIPGYNEIKGRNFSDKCNTLAKIASVLRDLKPGEFVYKLDAIKRIESKCKHDDNFDAMRFVNDMFSELETKQTKGSIRVSGDRPTFIIFDDMIAESEEKGNKEMKVTKICRFTKPNGEVLSFDNMSKKEGKIKLQVFEVGTRLDFFKIADSKKSELPIVKA